MSTENTTTAEHHEAVALSVADRCDACG
ncbi:MAG: hypothetical protein RJA26_283, partial [Actinomycetota bacterium]